MPHAELELIDLFPIVTHPHTPRELALEKYGIEPLRPIRRAETCDNLLDAIIDGNGAGDVHSAFEDALKASPVYKKWQSSMPYLKDVPQLSAYRNKKKKLNDVEAINRELMRVGGHLPFGQVLYRGGCFLTSCISISDGPISTSMHPSVAWWHAKEVKGQIAILRIADNGVLGFVYKATGHQRLKHEYEVLLQNHLRLEQTSTRLHIDMEIRSYNVYGGTKTPSVLVKRMKPAEAFSRRTS